MTAVVLTAMTAIEPFRLTWAPRASPLVACGAVAVGATARVLAQRLAARDDAALGALTGVAADALLIVIGDPAALPWVDGISYLGCDAAAPGLLLPTALAPSIPPRVLEAAVRARMEPGPVAVLTAPARLVPCGAARAIDRAQLVAWQARS